MTISEVSRRFPQFKFLPVNSDKHPLIIKWTDNASNDPTQIEDWSKKWPHCNFGILTGRASGIFVLDVDGDDGRECLRVLEAEYGALPSTLTARTGRGTHYYFRYPDTALDTAIKCSTGKLGSGLDIRGDRGFVVCPPSVHASGKPYQWLDQNAQCSDAPDWLLRLLTDEDVADEPISEGQRTNTLHAEACRLFRAGSRKEDVLSVLLAINAERCNPPLPDSKVADVVERVSKSHRPAILRMTARSPLRWFAFDVPSFLANESVATLTDAQLGWRTRLHAVAWMNAGRLQNDPAKLAKVANATSPARFKREMLTALFDYEPIEENGQPVLINRQMAEEYDEKLVGWIQKRDAGIARAKQREGQERKAA